jgi:hypothetical protein
VADGSGGKGGRWQRYLSAVCAVRSSASSKDGAGTRVPTDETSMTGTGMDSGWWHSVRWQRDEQAPSLSFDKWSWERKEEVGWVSSGENRKRGGAKAKGIAHVGGLMGWGVMEEARSNREFLNLFSVLFEFWV